MVNRCHYIVSSLKSVNVFSKDKNYLSETNNDLPSFSIHISEYLPSAVTVFKTRKTTSDEVPDFGQAPRKMIGLNFKISTSLSHITNIYEHELRMIPQNCIVGVFPTLLIYFVTLANICPI